jgi:hypothetical protein
MKVFISWSGERSRLVADALRYWLPKVIQAIQPWMSSSDIEKGTRWRTDIASELEQSSIGIICLTPENLTSTWLHFEAGALSKQQQNTYVCTFLYGLEPADIREPLAQFQTTKAQREDVLKLVRTINNALSDNKLPDSEVSETFDVWWPKLEQRLSDVPEYQSSPNAQRDEREILEEILEIVRSQARSTQSTKFEATLSEPYFVSTVGWSANDAKKIFDYYKTLEKLIRVKENPSFRTIMDRIITDEAFARQQLAILKNIEGTLGKVKLKGKESTTQPKELSNEDADS